LIKLAHFSDVHLSTRPLGWTRHDLFSKKVAGWMNVKLLGRGHRFKHADRVVAALRQDLATRSYDQLVFSGDATTLAFETEFAVSAKVLLGSGLPPCVAVPGNHDYYTGAAVRAKLFEKHYGPWLDGVRVDGHTFPFAKKVGHAWLIAVNSSTANLWTFDASGAMGAEQLTRLKTLCEQLDPGPRILVTHYPLRTAKGLVERRTHRLRDHAAALAACKACGVNLWLHGHIHTPYVNGTSEMIPFPTICAGSCTQTHKWRYNEYILKGDDLHIRFRRFNLVKGAFVDDGERSLRLNSH
jgi:3',5'-cyclic AMP phosphodiesterase CpdA